MRKFIESRRAWRIVCVLTLLLSCGALRAEYGDLLNQTHRPTAEEFLAKVQPWPATNPFGTPTGTIRGLERSLAQTIVAMEKAYPGATWAPLGRDAANFGAALDAFYTAMGQPNRVVYLRASGDSIRGAGVTKKTLVKFLESAGLDLDPKSGKKQRPFVIIDRTSYGASSQLGKLLGIGYDEWEKNGGRRQDLVRLFNGLNFSSAIKPETDTEKFLRNQRRIVAKNGGKPTALMGVNRFDSNQTGDGNAWHYIFGTIERHSDGYYADPKQYPTDFTPSRKQILADMYEAIRLARDQTFQKKVAHIASQAGVTLSFKPSDFKPPPPPKPAKPKSISTLKSELRKLVSALPVKKGHIHGVSQNAQNLLKWLDDAVAASAQADRNDVILYFLGQVSQAKKGQQIGRQDIRALVASALRQADITSQFISDLCAVIKKNSRIKKVLENEVDYFMKQDAPIKGAYQKIVKKLSETQGCQLQLKKLVAT